MKDGKKLRRPRYPIEVEEDHDGDELKVSLKMSPNAENLVAHLQITTVDVEVAGAIVWSSTSDTDH